MDFYLLEFKLNGIKNIEKEIAISFYKQDIRKFNRENYNVKGIFGRNGIGKTAIIKGIEILRNIVLDSDYLILKSSLLNEIINKKIGKGSFANIELNIRNKILNFNIEEGIDVAGEFVENLKGDIDDFDLATEAIFKNKKWENYYYKGNNK